MTREKKPQRRGSGSATKKGPVAGGRRASAPIVFTDVQFLKVGVKPPFPNDEGHFIEPDIVVVGGREPMLPENVPCPGSLVIYSSWAENVANCNGFVGPGAGNNAVVNSALQNAIAVAAKIPCADDCPKHTFEIWRGWNCGGNPKPITATGAVEVMIQCRIEL